MGVEVVGDLSHHGINGPRSHPEHLVGHPAQLGQHVLAVGVGRIGGMRPPHHHGNGAYFAGGNPAHLVLVVPGRQSRRFAQLTAGHGYLLYRVTVVPGNTDWPAAGLLKKTRPVNAPPPLTGTNPRA
jgi:hypothetical protein